MAQLDTGTDRKKIIRARVEVSGIIQGVGFRPLIYRLAKTIGLTGQVANTAAGVTIELDGTEQDIERFAKSIYSEKPPLASIEEFRVIKSDIEPDDTHQNFQIIESISAGNRIGPITPDSDVCDSCLSELFNPNDRRYLYPFINCTDCGPRYTLIEKTPYDRPLTAMKHFELCELCQAEYRDPIDRRFHAQATCCPACGPSVTLTTPDGQTIEDSDPIRRATDLLKEGKIVAIKGIGGFHLAVNAVDHEAVAKLRERKGRPDKPLAVMVGELDQIKNFASFSLDEQNLLRGREKPIVLLQKNPSFPLVDNVAPDNRFIGVMLPYTPIHHLLFYYHEFQALIMTSGNISGSPVVKDNEEAFEKLANIADYFLLHNRPIVTQADDSVIRVSGSNTALYRRARSFVPSVVNLKRDSGRTLALGAIIKNTICMTKEKEAFLSQHIGDLDNMDTQIHQKNISRHFQSLLRIEPDLLVHDLHPDYPGSRYARNQTELPTIGVQHHHAHAVSCMAEHGLSGPVIALTLDGNGYGPDNTVWGGEVLLAHYENYERLAHLSSVEMPGGDAAIREPWRMAVSHLYRAFGHDYKGLKLHLVHDHKDKIDIMQQMIDKSINSPLTSSCGRLFDSVAALLGLRYSSSFEGQAAAELEMLLEPDDRDTASYPFEIIKSDSKPWLLPVKPIITGIVHDILENNESHHISKRFHNTLASLFTRVCREIRDLKNINQIVLSGGVFQNLNLSRQLKTNLEALAFTVYSHEQVPTNDGGISLGQALAGRAMWERLKAEE
ncbi:MAG: carbamoyltransferase HypF [Deltaproteobacteria bacterium]|nr:MAG: carbamoyltransferase HypF [Deltaproteobacteria bacterium]